MEIFSPVTMVMRHCLLVVWCYLESHFGTKLTEMEYNGSACTYCGIEFPSSQVTFGWLFGTTLTEMEYNGLLCYSVHVYRLIQWKIAEFGRGGYSEEIKTCCHGDGTAAIAGHNRPLLL